MQEETGAPSIKSNEAWREIASQLQVECEFEDFVNADEDVLTCEPPPDPTRCVEAQGASKPEDPVSEEEMEGPEEPVIPNSQDVIEALQTIQRHLQYQ